MRDAGHHDAVEVGEDVGEGFGVRGRVLGQAGADVAGCDWAGDWVALDSLEVLGDPVDERVAVLSELFRRHGANLRGGSLRRRFGG